MQDYAKLISGKTRFDEMYGIVNTQFDVVRSQFSGAQFPANPTVGQPCFRTDMNPPQTFVFDGNAWKDNAGQSPAVTAVGKEVQNARGSAASLEARLDVALNQDGTLKTDMPVGGWWTREPDAVSRLSDNQFTIAGDKRHVYVKRRAVMLEQDVDVVSWVFSAIYQSGVTVVSLSDPVVDTGLTGVAFGQEVGNEPAMQGFKMVTVEVVSPDGWLDVALSSLGLPSIEKVWFPLLQTLGPAPYLATAHNVTAHAFTVRLFLPDGKPGAYVSTGFAECGAGLQCGNGLFSGQAVPVRGVAVGCFIPL